MKYTLTPDMAQELAIEALGFIAQDQELLERFLALSGIHASDIRQAAETPEFFAGILSFLLGHESTLLEFCQRQNIHPETIAQAFSLLPGGGLLMR